MRALLLPLPLVLACGEPEPEPVVPPVSQGASSESEEVVEAGDPRLADLRVDGASLIPSTFNPDVFNYRASVGSGTSRIAVRATPMQEDATVTVDGWMATGPVNLTLAYGRNDIPIRVVDRDGEELTYQLAVTRAAGGALSLSVEVDPDQVAAFEEAVVSVQARVSASSGATVDEVTLLSGELVPMDVAIFDDGVAPDEVAGDGVYTGEILLEDGLSGGRYPIDVQAEGRDTSGGLLRVSESGELAVFQEYDRSVSSASFSSIASTGTRVLTSGSAAVTLPFDIGFFGETLPSGSTIHPDEFGQVHVGSYGGGVVPGPLDRYRGVVDKMWAVYHHSSAVVTGGGVYTHVVGEAPHRELVLEWQGRYRSGEGSIQTQLRLREGSSTFEIRYGTITNDLFQPEGWAQFAFSEDQETTHAVAPTLLRPANLNNRRFLYEW